MRLSLLLFMFALTSCAPTVWDKPGATQADFSRDSAQCRLVARGMNSDSFYAEGSPKFVAGAALGNAVGTAVSTAATYRDCMMAIGYTPQQTGVASTDSATAISASSGNSHCGGDIRSADNACKGN
jgi:hypothetical protein